MSSPVTKLSFWGVRGSTPTVDPATWRYGGNTPCLELTAPDGTQFILDCGTGLRVLGSRWTPPVSPRAAEGIANLLQAAELRPGYADLHFHLGRAFLKTGQSLRAISSLNRALDINPHVRQ